MLYSKIVYCFVIINARMAFASIKAPSKRGAKLTNEAMVGDAEIAEFECKADNVSEEVWSMDAPVDEDGPVYIGMGQCTKGRRLDDCLSVREIGKRVTVFIPRETPIGHQCFQHTLL